MRPTVDAGRFIAENATMGMSREDPAVRAAP
jgi:hypothetical protein